MGILWLSTLSTAIDFSRGLTKESLYFQLVLVDFAGHGSWHDMSDLVRRYHKHYALHGDSPFLVAGNLLFSQFFVFVDIFKVSRHKVSATVSYTGSE